MYEITVNTMLNTSVLMVSVLASSVEGRGFDPRLCKTKEIK